MNHKRVYRVHQETELSVRRKAQKRLVQVGSNRTALTAANQEWALDFASNRMASGRSISC